MNKILSTLFTVVAVLMFAGIAQAASITTTWDAPTTNTDGTPLTDLAGYRVFVSDTSGAYCRAGSPPKFDFSACDNRMRETVETSYVWDGLTTRTYFFVITAHDFSGNHSDYSNEVSVDITADDQTIIAPITGLTGACTNITINNCINCINTCE